MFDLFVPLKNLRLAKGRLQSCLSDEARRSLVVAMARDLVDVALREPRVHRVYLILGEHWDAEIFPDERVRIIPESTLNGGGLNGLLDDAVTRFGAEKSLVLHGDLPYVDGAALSEVADALAGRQLLLIPDREEIGTNGVGFSGSRIPFCFGEDSFSSHRDRAREARHLWRVIHNPLLGRDIDTPEDLCELYKAAATGSVSDAHTLQWLLRAENDHGPDTSCSFDALGVSA